MTCRELNDFLGDYVCGELDPQARARFEAHLADCPECAVYLQSYIDTIRLARETSDEPDDPVPATVPDRLVRAILEARGAAGGPATPGRRRR